MANRKTMRLNHHIGSHYEAPFDPQTSDYVALEIQTGDGGWEVSTYCFTKKDTSETGRFTTGEFVCIELLQAIGQHLALGYQFARIAPFVTTGGTGTHEED